MIVPTRRSVLLLAAGFPVALLPALVAPPFWPAWAAVFAATLAALAAELLLGLPPRRVAIEALLPEALYVGGRDVLTLEIRTGWPWTVAFDVICDFDESLALQPAARATAGRSPGLVEVPLVPLRRGTAAVHGVWLRWKGPLGLLQWTVERPLGRAVAILPNVRAVRGAAVRFFSTRQFLSGLKVWRYPGDGSEFESLREHMSGFDPRSIDWKASARHHKLLCREYRAERNHTVVLALDTGYLMGEPVSGIPKLDHAINASLLLAYVALKTGDRVGLFAFDERVRFFAEPQGGVQSFGRLQRQAAALDYTRAETNFTLGLLALGQRLRRRALVVVLTDFVDTVTAELMLENLERLGRIHLVLFVALRDTALEMTAGADPRGLDELNRAMTAHDLIRERDVVLSRLRRQGIHYIDGPPAAVSTRLINRYLDVKRRELV